VVDPAGVEGRRTPFRSVDNIAAFRRNSARSAPS
jgi:hypothetical protein